MACVTLKRPLDLDHFEGLHSPNLQPPTKRHRCSPMKVVERDGTGTTSSVLRDDSASAKADQMREILRPARHLAAASRSSPSTPSRPVSMEETMPMSTFTDATNNQDDVPVFTLKTMKVVAEKVCRDRLEVVRHEFGAIVQRKLDEQQDSFNRFIDQLIQQRIYQSEEPTYLS